MEYPIQILPSPNRKWIDCPLDNYFLTRYYDFELGEQIMDPDTGNIMLKHICSPKENIRDLSTSLLGIFTTQHNNLSFTTEGKAKYMFYCEPSEEVQPPMEFIDFSIAGNRGCWCVQISKVDGKAFEYKQNKDTLLATSRVQHTPMKWNFWHFSLRWDLNSGPIENLEEREQKKIAQKIGHAARVLISHHATANVPPHEMLPAECYSGN
jgi:hypothetical protein